MKKVFYFCLILVFFLGAFFVWQWERKESETEFPKEENEEQPVVVSGRKYFVSVSGNDSNDGLSENTAWFSIQKAVDMLEPGDGVYLSPGTYFQDFSTRQNGTRENPIVIWGDKEAIIKGTGKKSRIIEINHDYQVLKGFTVDGLDGDKNNEKNYRDKLIYLQSLVAKDGVEGVRILDLELKNAGGECLRMKYFAQENEVAHNRITGCGAFDFIFDGEGKNGEGIYIGTAPEQTDDGKNPTEEVDQSNQNWIHHNYIETRGNECVDIKEGSSGNLIEKNQCTGQRDKESAGLDSRGSGNIFRFNESYGNEGAGIRLGGDKKNDGINNIVIENYLHNNQGGGIKIQRSPQGSICGNRLEDNKKGDLVGEYGQESENRKKCD